MDIKIKVKVSTEEELESWVEAVKDIEKEYNCTCIILEVEAAY